MRWLKEVVREEPEGSGGGHGGSKSLVRFLK
jgi:hypothetical protein